MTSPVIPNVRSLVVVPALNNAVIPITKWDVTLSAYGSPGTFRFTTAIQGNPDLIALTQQQATISRTATGLMAVTSAQLTKVLIYCGYVTGNNIANPGPQDLPLIFSGYIDMTEWIYDKDELIVTGRDLSSVLQDSRVIISNTPTGVNATGPIPEFQSNITPSQLAILFAQQAQLSYLVEPSPLNSEGKPITVGYIFEHNRTTTGYYPRPRWDILLVLARDIGFEVFVLPSGTLYFGPPPKEDSQVAKLLNINHRDYHWRDPQYPMVSAVDGGPIKTLTFKHNPRRSGNFQILVKSYHPKTVQQTDGKIVLFGVPISIPITGQTTKKIAVKGQAYNLIFNELSNTTEFKNIPVYTFYYDGMTPDQAQQKAEAIAADIGKREFMVDAEVLGDPWLSLFSIIHMKGTATFPLGRFETVHFYPQRITHTFEISGGGGFMTRFQALTIPLEAVANPSEVFE
jgi:hypothetical protein